LIDLGKQTLLRGNFSLPLFAVVLWASLVAVLGFLSWVFVRASIVVIFDPHASSVPGIIPDKSGNPGNVWQDLVVAPWSILQFYGFLVYERWVARRQKAFLIDFLRVGGAERHPDGLVAN